MEKENGTKIILSQQNKAYKDEHLIDPKSALSTQLFDDSAAQIVLISDICSNIISADGTLVGNTMKMQQNLSP